MFLCLFVKFAIQTVTFYLELFMEMSFWPLQTYVEYCRDHRHGGNPSRCLSPILALSVTTEYTRVLINETITILRQNLKTKVP